MKKILFALTIVISCLIFTPNVFAINYLPDSQIVNFNTYNSEELSTELYRGDSSDLNDFIVGNNFSTGFLSYYDRIKQYVAQDRGYSSWENLLNDFYYITTFHVYNINSNNPQLQISIHFLNRSSDNYLTYFVPYLSATSRTTSTITSNTEIMVSYGIRFWQVASYGFLKDILSIDDSEITSHTSAPSPASFYCKNGYSSCNATYSNNVMSLNIYQYFNGGNLFYFDTNNPQIDIKFGQHDFFYSSFGYYWYNKAKINNGSTIYNMESQIGIFSDYTSIEQPNIQDLGNNSFGINTNTLNNYISSSDNTFVPVDITCPTDRNFINGVCNVYGTDFTNFSNSFTNFNNQIFFYFGQNSGVNLISGKYYVLTIRLYTSYNLKPTAMVFKFPNDRTDYPVNDIYNVTVNDYSLYKDLQIVFDMPSGVNGQISYFTILFDSMSNYTNSLDSNYNFGVFKTLKLSQFDTLPDSATISSNYNNNNLTTISNNDNSSFFTNFSLNDYGLSSVVLLPLNFVRNLSNTSCSPISLPIQRIGNFNLPCISSFMTTNFNSIWSIYKLIINGLIVYKIIINLFSLIKSIYRPDYDNIEVIDL